MIFFSANSNCARQSHRRRVKHVAGKTLRVHAHKRRRFCAANLAVQQCDRFVLRARALHSEYREYAEARWQLRMGNNFHPCRIVGCFLFLFASHKFESEVYQAQTMLAVAHAQSNVVSSKVARQKTVCPQKSDGIVHSESLKLIHANFTRTISRNHSKPHFDPRTSTSKISTPCPSAPPPICKLCAPS